MIRNKCAGRISWSVYCFPTYCLLSGLSPAPSPPRNLTFSAASGIIFPHAPVAQWIERLTSNPVGCLYAAFIGGFSVFALDGVNPETSIESIKSILSTPIAPKLHRIIVLRTDRMGTPCPTEDRGGLRPRLGQTGRERSEYPVVSEAKIRSLDPGRSRSDHPINWFSGLVIL